MNTPPPDVPTWISLLPMGILFLSMVAIIFFIAKRKGQSPAVALIGLIPLVNFLFVIWLCSLTDAAVLKELERLRDKVDR